MSVDCIPKNLKMIIDHYNNKYYCETCNEKIRFVKRTYLVDSNERYKQVAICNNCVADVAKYDDRSIIMRT